MLRKDTIYVSKSQWEPRVPTTEAIQAQVSGKRLAGSIRLADGKVTGADEKSGGAGGKKAKRRTHSGLSDDNRN